MTSGDTRALKMGVARVFLTKAGNRNLTSRKNRINQQKEHHHGITESR